MSPVVAPPDPFDADLSALHTHVDSLGPWIAIWEARREPDPHARRCAADAVSSIDAALAALHHIRGELVGQVRRADDEAAVRADALLARTGRPPPMPTPGGRPPHESPPPPNSDKGLR